MATKVPQQKRVAGIAAFFAGASLVFTASVHGQTNPPNPGGSAVSQYAELVPAAVGSKAPGAEAKTEKTQDSLPPAAKNALKQAPPAIAKPLEKIATSSTYGAPERRAEPNATKPETRAPVRDPDAVPPGAGVEEVALGTTVSAIASATDERLLGLLLTMLVTMLGAVALAVRRAQVA
jgi:hypothetical protein